MNSLRRAFFIPTLIALVLLGGVFGYLGPAALLTAVLLIILEFTLSFDNAVVNASVLKRMDPVWQHRFLTWGILIAVFGTRLVLPILIVAAGVGLSPWVVTELALFNPAEYGHLLEGAHYAIGAFGGIFLLMVALKYFFDTNKDVHWIQSIERHVAKWGHLEAVEIVAALIILLVVSMLVPAESATILASGIVGLVTFVLTQGIANAFSVEGESVAGAVAKGGLSLFLYLEVLDASFSLDGVIAAFAITSVLPVILIGLGIGALFVRSLTIYLVEQKTLDSLIYVEHGAHWAILGLAAAMLISLVYPLPELVIGLIGITFIAASFYSSFRERARARATAAA
jgi:hypothetical protein